MTGIFINGLSGKMGTSLLNRSNLDNNIFICKDIDDKEVEVVIDFSHPSSTIETLDAINFASLRIRKFHEMQSPIDINFTDDLGVGLGALWRPISMGWID